MPITFLVRSGGRTSGGGAGSDISVRRDPSELNPNPSEPPSLTFDGTQRVVIGRGQGCDVRLPDPSVSHRHASVQARGAEYMLVDEGSTNGTFVGQARLAPRTSRVLRSGDMIRIGRVWLETRLDQSPVTRDLAHATRELALGLVAQAMRNQGEDVIAKALVVEGEHDLGAALELSEEGRAYVVGRGETCDLPLADPAASREHVQIVRRGGVVLVRDLGGRNPATLGDSPLESGRDTVWRSAVMLRLAHTVLALKEPVAEALGELESSPDEMLPEEGAPPPPLASLPRMKVASQSGGGARELSGMSPLPSSSNAPAPPLAVDAPPRGARATRGKKSGWSLTDILVMLAALSVLGLSIAGLIWLLRG